MMMQVLFRLLMSLETCPSHHAIIFATTKGMGEGSNIRTRNIHMHMGATMKLGCHVT